MRRQSEHQEGPRGTASTGSIHFLAIAVLTFALSAAGQISTPATREETILQERERKSQALTPEEPSKLEQRMLAIRENDLLGRVIGDTYGLRIAMGGLLAGQGFAIGPEYKRRDLWDGRLMFRTSVRASAKQAYLADFELGLPKLAGGKMFVDFLTIHRNYPEVPYFGPGPDSREEDRTGYRREDTSVEVRSGVRLGRYVKAGAIGGFTAVNTGPDADGLVVPVQIPGADRQTSFVRGGGSLQFDNRNFPGEPTRGGNYRAEYQMFSDRNLKAYSFGQLELEAQQYIPFLNDKRVIALRARTVLTEARDRSTVPFYMQPMLGGSNSLRGFEQFRFYDNNSLLFTAEYRFEVFSGLDMAVFADSGKVFPRWSQLNFHDLEVSEGFGFRGNFRNNVFLRIDTAFSREGYQVWLKFDNVF
jgi:Omp85 superfamily domain